MEKVILSDYGYHTAQIEINASCNMACSFCPYPLKEDKVTKLPWQDIKNIIDQIDSGDKKLRWLAFSHFNEPLLDNRLFEIADYAKKSGFKILLTTNGVLLNKEKNIEGIFNLKPQVKISLQVLDSNLHKKERGLNLDMDRYVETIVDFCKKAKNKDFNVQVDVGCGFNTKFSYYLRKVLGTSTGDPSVPRNIRTTILQLREILKKFYEVSDDEYKENLMALIDIKKVKKIFSKDYFNQDGFDVYKNVNIKIRQFWYGRKLQDFKPIDNNFSCMSDNLGILADGNLVPCCLAYSKDISLGQLKTQSFKILPKL